MKHSLSCALISGILALLLGGCATGFDTDRAHTSLVDVRLAPSSTVLETGLELTLRITNESDQPLQLSGSSHELMINGSSVGRGANRGAVTISPLDSALIRVVVHLENLKLVQKFAGRSIPSAIDYRLESRLLRAAGGSLRVATDGAIDLRPFLGGLNLQP